MDVESERGQVFRVTGNLGVQLYTVCYLGLINGMGNKHKPDFDLDMLDHIYSPAGLHIGSVTPEEIALAILSEILAVYRGITPESLRNRSASKIKK